MCDLRFTIPQFGENQNTESLNIAMATAITLGEWKSRNFKF